MPPFKIDLPSSSLLNVLLLVAWLVYLAWYWRSMVQILAARAFDSADKILWFLVITLAPLLGLITFHAMCPPHVLNPVPRVDDVSPPP